MSIFDRPPPAARRRPGFRLRFTAAVILLAWLAGAASNGAGAFETSAKEMILVDDITGAVMLDKNSDRSMFPASMSKLMTLYIVFNKLTEGSLSLDAQFRVSEKAWRMGGSKMFVELNSRVTVSDLLRGVIVQSGNDACIVLAEGIAGSETQFVELMNAASKKLGLANSHFMNVTGWPHPEHVTTARDLAILAHAVIRDFPQFYGIFKEKNFTFNGIKQGNRNPLLYTYPGADGLKTGHTQASGYGLTASASRGGRRLIVVANGMSNVNERAREVERLLDHGFTEYSNYTLFKAGDIVEQIEVWLGDKVNVPLIINHDLTVTLSRTERRDLKVKVLAPGPIPAPVNKGAEVAKLVVISAADKKPIEFPLVAGTDVGRLSAFGRIGGAFNHLLWGEQKR
ncbi:MAG: D-alanyl-D-alanine carboxypeptidase family protein [Alphaproteobacteria bacterium]|jgi:D-alanyl-D-alanine carboxypeptidase (penicillin-binding protein 5/6)|nr:D-alanyl-D-alanine carboxypeptidase family protein [Alphaproteobacteria bacterium]MDP6589355.1 D-alanyl-D-alanine carboxypeptidase family protein [Alphaproteobacteria bacterium]MDP6818926.1 D-alanyl-D-alanine carboxypeptidase family protein [Alphaproteobacteria bacterium]|tara:strand:- start:59 stop:1252 length:1194 start_codon:yes stop_codon:yes gene_type:complete